MRYLKLAKQYSGTSVSFYLDVDIADEFVHEIIENDEKIFEENTYEDLLDILDSNDVVIVTKDNDGIFYVEGLYGKHCQVFNEVDVAFIQEDLLDMIDLERIACDEILTLKLSDEEVEEECECCNDDESELSTEDIFDKLSLNMELERMENFDKEVVISDEVKESDLFLDAKAECEVFTYMVKTLNAQGVDLQSSGSVSAEYINHKHRLKELEYQVRMQQI